MEVERNTGLSKDQQRWVQSVGDMDFLNNSDKFGSVSSFADDAIVSHACSCTVFSHLIPRLPTHRQNLNPWRENPSTTSSFVLFFFLITERTFSLFICRIKNPNGFWHQKYNVIAK